MSEHTEPKTRMEAKRQGKRDSGPYSARHVRAAAALFAKRAASGAGPKTPVGAVTGTGPTASQNTSGKNVPKGGGHDPAPKGPASMIKAKNH